MFPWEGTTPPAANGRREVRGLLRRSRHAAGLGALAIHGRLSIGEHIMKAMKNLLVKLVEDEQGGEVLEYALIAGLIVVAAIAVIGAVGTKVLARWSSLNSSM